MAEESPILGIPEIDQPLTSALPMGWLALLKGSTGAGSSVLAKQFAHAGIGSVPVLFYTTYERTEDVRQSFSDFGWDPDGVKIVNLADEYTSASSSAGWRSRRPGNGGWDSKDSSASSWASAPRRPSGSPTGCSRTSRRSTHRSGLSSTRSTSSSRFWP